MMFKKVLPIVASLIAVMLLTVACNNQKTTDDQTTNQTQNGETDNPNETTKNDEATLPDPVLQKTDQSEDVKSLQQVLNKLGYQVSINSKFDAMTTWAITDFQMQQKDMPITGIYNKATKQALKKTLKKNQQINPGSALDKPDQNKKVASNPHEILVLVNKKHSLPDGFKPKHLVVPDVKFPFEEFRQKKQMRKVAANALEKLFDTANQAGLELFAQSGFRSFNRQDAIFASNVEAYGEEAANNVSARPGESEHQTGLTMDVTSPDVGFNLNTDFGKTDEGQWLKKHAAEYGFIIRYPKGKENITKYQYEPWHLRYVGTKAATEIMNKGMTLEEFLGKK